MQAQTTNFVGQRVKMYRNLNNGMIALRDLNNKVIGYCNNIHLIDCETKTSSKSAERIREKLKNEGKQAREVIAFIIGTVVSHDINEIVSDNIGQRISYNPFKSDDFYYCHNMKPFTECSEVKAFAAPKGKPMITLAYL